MTASQEAVRFDPVEHRYYRGLQELHSVTKVIREAWPIKPSWDGVDPAVIDNARDRGVEVDTLFSGWLNGTLKAIPAGTREDAKERFLALVSWWSGLTVTSKPGAQLLLCDDEIAGTCDVNVNIGGLPHVWDLKNTAQIESTYSMQLGAYAELYEKKYGALPSVGVIHVTQPKDKPVSVKLVKFDATVAVSEWRLLRQFWGLVRRKAGKKS